MSLRGTPELIPILISGPVGSSEVPGKDGAREPGKGFAQLIGSIRKARTSSEIGGSEVCSYTHIAGAMRRFRRAHTAYTVSTSFRPLPRLTVVKHAGEPWPRYWSSNK